MELAEILAEARRLEAAYLADQCLMSWDALISHQHGSFPRLARVAEAAMEMRRLINFFDTSDEFCAAVARFDDAVRGEP